jgi:DNA-binding SARP family transcriptional activator
LLAGERDVLRALPGAYLLTLPDDGVDAREFERLADRGRALLGEGRPVEAARRLTAALALWRGPPLGGLAPGPVLSGHVERLTELRARVRELRIEADLARGLHADLVGELRGLVADDPLNEQMQVRLMDALHRCGRRGDALASFHHAQVALHEQLGVEPSHELLDARRRVLAAGAAPLGVPLNGAACSPVPVAHPSLASVTDNDADISWR